MWGIDIEFTLRPGGYCLRAAQTVGDGEDFRGAVALAWSSALNRCVYIPSVVVTLLCPMNQLSSGGRIPAATGTLA